MPAFSSFFTSRRMVRCCGLRPSKNMPISSRRLQKLKGFACCATPGRAREDDGIRFGPPGSEQLFERLHAVIDQRQRAVLRSGEFLVDFKAEAVIDGGGHFGGSDGPRFWNVTQLVRFADHLTALNRAAAHDDRP